MTLKVQLIVVGILIASIVALSALLKIEKAERKRTESNQTVLLDEIDHYKTEHGKQVASVGILTLKVKELKEFRANDAAVIRDLEIKARRVKTIQNTVTVTETEIETVIKDSVVYVKGVRDTLQCIDYKTPYMTIDGCVWGGVFIGAIENRDTLTQVVHRVPRKFLFFKWGTKGIKQEVFNTNPNSTIEFAEYIQIK